MVNRRCPNCDSTEAYKVARHRRQCKDCGRYWRTVYAKMPNLVIAQVKSMMPGQVIMLRHEGRRCVKAPVNRAYCTLREYVSRVSRASKGKSWHAWHTQIGDVAVACYADGG